MSSLQDDIIKYKSGQLSPKEMHALEKRALNDPFLADALEGVENISSENFAKDIADLNQKIREPKKTILFTPLRIAAGVIFIAASILVFYQLTPETKTIALKNDKPSTPVAEPKKEPTVVAGKEQPKQPEKVDGKKAGEGPKILKADREKEKPVETKTETHKVASAPVEKVDTSKPTEEKPKEAIAQTFSAPEKKAEDTRTETKDAPVSIAMQPMKQLAADDEAKKENATSRARKSAAKLDVSSGVAAGASQVNPSGRITGKVTSADDGAPLPGVNVVVAGTTQGTVTDTQGNYSLPSSSGESQKLVFSFIGMETREEDTNGKTKMDVTLKQDASQLSEVVVAGYGVKHDDDAEPVVHLASPIGGMRAYNKYLDNNVRYPQEALKENIKGKVKVEFSVKTDGSLDDYKVVKSLGHGCDEEVIRLIKDGPKWSPGTENGQPVESTVLVGVKFDPAKAGR